MNKVYVVFGHARDYESHFSLAICGLYDKEEANKACKQLNCFVKFNREYEKKLEQFKLDWEEKHPDLFAKDIFGKELNELTEQEQEEYNQLDFERLENLESAHYEYNERNYQLPSELLKFVSLMKKLFADIINDIYPSYDWKRIEFRVEELSIFEKAENIEV